MARARVEIGRRRWARGPAAALLFLAVGCEDPSIVGTTGWFQPRELDFGPRQVGVEHALEVRFVNQLSKIIRVEEVVFAPFPELFDVRTAVGRRLRGESLSARGSVALDVSFRPVEAGVFASTMVLELDDGERVELPIAARGEAEAIGPLVVRPASVSFPSTEIDRDVVQSIEIENPFETEAEIVDLQLLESKTPATSSSEFYATLGGSATSLFSAFVPARTTVRADVHFRPRSAGTKAERLLIKLKSGHTTVLAVSGTAVPSGRLGCEPNPIDFGALARGASAEEDLSCRSTGGIITIAEVAFLGGASDRFALPIPFGGELTLREGERLRTRVRFDASGLAARHAAVLRVATANGQVVDLPVSGEVHAPPLEETDLGIELVWAHFGIDLDLHVVRAGGQLFEALNDCHFMHKQQDWGTLDVAEDDAYLDKDNIEGFGPERFSLKAAAEPSYEIFVHYYLGPALANGTTATVKIHVQGRPPEERVKVLPTCGEMWKVGRVRFSGGVGTFEPLDTTTDDRARAKCP